MVLAIKGKRERERQRELDQSPEEIVAALAAAAATRDFADYCGLLSACFDGCAVPKPLFAEFRHHRLLFYISLLIQLWIT